ncbi:MAG: hypothetical protein K9J18_00750 [Crocinitomicaceae bacterium]|nr:hypothetical protein [Crocinitomicaceae bacterium]
MLAKTLQTDEQQIRKNEDLLNDFQFAFLIQNIKRITALLDPKGKFFGKQNIHFGKSKLYQLMQHDGKEERCFAQMCSRGFSLDEQPGQTVLEFRFPILEEENFSAFELHRDRFGEAPDPKLDEIVLRFALVLKDGKISEIRIPSKVAQSLEQFINEN